MFMFSHCLLCFMVLHCHSTRYGFFVRLYLAITFLLDTCLYSNWWHFSTLFYCALSTASEVLRGLNLHLVLHRGLWASPLISHPLVACPACSFVPSFSLLSSLPFCGVIAPCQLVVWWFWTHCSVALLLHLSLVTVCPPLPRPASLSCLVLLEGEDVEDEEEEDDEAEAEEEEEDGG